MGFVLTEEQQMLRDAALGYLADKLPVKAFRDQRGTPERFDGAAWSEMAEMGWAGVLVPEAFGGSALGHVGMGQLLEAQGRTLAASPLLSTGLIAASALTLAGTEEQQREHLPPLAAGRRLFALAVDEGAHHRPDQIIVSADPLPDGGFRLDGDKRFVADGAAADWLIVAARSTGQPGTKGGLSLFLVPPSTPGVSRTTLSTLDSRDHANISFRAAEIPADAALGPVGEADDLIDALLDRARIGLAAEMLGAAEAAFAMTTDYLKTRRQFGQFIGSFQALQHRAAVMFTELELTRSCVAAALSALDDRANSIAELASLAKARAAETLHLVTNETVQMHGGIGMTDEHDAGLFLKRARVLEALYGSASFHRDRYARLQGF
jgi:alkylation response protein AidB-like acyl-CoA dehydrogenase